MKFDFKNWDLGGKIIFISSCAAVLSFLLPWVDIGIATRNGFSQGTFLLFILFLYPLIYLMQSKDIVKLWGIVLGALGIIITILYYASKSIEIGEQRGNASGSGVFLFLIASVGLIVGVVMYRKVTGTKPN